MSMILIIGAAVLIAGPLEQLRQFYPPSPHRYGRRRRSHNRFEAKK